MLIQTVRSIAKTHGIKSSRMPKAALIRAVQLAEGNFDCFGTPTGYCDQSHCFWREDCLKSGSANKR